MKEIFKIKYLRNVNNKIDEKILKYTFTDFNKAKEHLINKFLKQYEMGVIKSNIRNAVFYVFVDEKTKKLIY